MSKRGGQPSSCHASTVPVLLSFEPRVRPFLAASLLFRSPSTMALNPGRSYSFARSHPSKRATSETLIPLPFCSSHGRTQPPGYRATAGRPGSRSPPSGSGGRAPAGSGWSPRRREWPGPRFHMAALDSRAAGPRVSNAPIGVVPRSATTPGCHPGLRGPSRDASSSDSAQPEQPRIRLDGRDVLKVRLRAERECFRGKVTDRDQMDVRSFRAGPFRHDGGQLLALPDQPVAQPDQLPDGRRGATARERRRRCRLTCLFPL